MATYSGTKADGGAGPQEVLKDGAPLSPAPSQRLRNHSPDGFNWGYGGSGPAQLALALLLDATRDKEVAQAYYQQFKFAVVAGWGDHWEITSAEIEAWLAEKKSAERGW